MDDLTPMQRYIISTIASFLGITPQLAVDDLGTPENLDSLAAFLKDGGKQKALLFCSERDDEGNVTSLKITQGARGKIAGDAVVCVKTTNRSITKDNICAELNFMMLPVASTDSGLLSGFNTLLGKILLPMVHSKKIWGKMDPADPTKESFIRTFQSLVTSLDLATSAVNTMVKLSISTESEPVMASLGSPKNYAVVATNPAVVQQLETQVMEWSEAIQAVIVANDAIRSEADNVGPHAELGHWRQQSSSFVGILDQMKRPQCVAAITVLKVAKSKILAQWMHLDSKITEKANEAADNAKFLQTINLLCEPLYHSDLQKMEENLPALLNAVAMINSASRFYNTPERMSALFIKITNQMINSSRDFIHRKEPRIWEQPTEELRESLVLVQKLHAAYQTAFNKEKIFLAKDPTGPQFDFSVMSIFGKSILFTERIEMIEKMRTVLHDWGKLANCKVSGIDPINVALRAQVKSIKAKTYDPLNIRNHQYAADAQIFHVAMEDVRSKLQDLCDSHCGVPMPSRSALKVLSPFEPLKFLGIKLTPHYQKVIQTFKSEIDVEGKVYQRDKGDPMIGRNMPPIAGRVRWARQGFLRIERTMTQLQKQCPELLMSPLAKKVIKSYNQVGRVLLEYELVFFASWVKTVETVESCLKASVLAFDGDSNRVAVNWDRDISTVLDEAKLLKKLGLELPPAAKLLLVLEKQIQSNRLVLEAVCDEHASALSSIPEVLRPVLQHSINGLNAAIRPGVEGLNWKSTNLDGFVVQTRAHLAAFKADLTIWMDILRVRILDNLDAICSTLICALPDEESWTIATFRENNDERFARIGSTLDRQNMRVEAGVEDLLLAMFNKIPATDVSEELKEAIDALRLFFSKEVEQAVVTAIKTSLDALKRATSNHGRAWGFSDEDESVFVPAFEVIVILDVTEQEPANPGKPGGGGAAAGDVKVDKSAFEISPTLEDVQATVTEVTDGLVGVSASVAIWGENRSSSNCKNLLRGVKDNKDVVRLTTTLSTIINANKGLVEDALKKFGEYDPLWQENRDTSMKAFLKTNPDLGTFDMEVAKYDGQEQELAALSDVTIVGPLSLRVDGVKRR